MPVLSLPEYLGIQEAPQQPVFQRTRQLAQPRSPWERDAQIADAMTQLRQQQPLSQIQAVQNEYDNIMMNAEKIRREREAASQAERAVSALAGLTPESDDYLKQRRQIMTQFPSAVLDPRVQSIMDDSDRMFNARQSSAARMEQERLAAEAARADEIQKRATSLIEMGVPPDQAMRDAQSPYTSAQAKFQRSQKPQGSRYEKALGTIQDLIRSVPEDERYDFVDGKQTVRPEFKALLDKQKQYADAYFREIEGEPVTPSVAPSAAPKSATVAATAAVDQAPASVLPAITPAANLEQELARIPVTEQAAWLAKRKEQETEAARINEAWTKAKGDLESKLKQKFPDKPYPGLKTSPLEQLALQIYNNVAVQDTSLPTMGDTALNIPIADKVLLDLGEDIFGQKPAFTEPGSKRKSLLGLIGTQNVSYGELIRDWAEKFLNSRGKLLPTSQSPTGSSLTEQQQKDLEELNPLIRAK